MPPEVAVRGDVKITAGLRSTSPASRIRQIAAHVDMSNFARRGQRLLREFEIEKAAVVGEELEILAASRPFQGGRRKLDLAGAGDAGRPMKETVKIVTRAGDLFSVASDDPASRNAAEINQERFPSGWHAVRRGARGALGARGRNLGRDR